MVKCTFCGNTLERGTGKMFVKTDGKIFYFCSNKCEKNLLKLRHVGRTTRWTKKFDKSKKKDDSIVEEKAEKDGEKND